MKNYVSSSLLCIGNVLHIHRQASFLLNRTHILCNSVHCNLLHTLHICVQRSPVCMCRHRQYLHKHQSFQSDCIRMVCMVLLYLVIPQMVGNNYLYICHNWFPWYYPLKRRIKWKNNRKHDHFSSDQSFTQTIVGFKLSKKKTLTVQFRHTPPPLYTPSVFKLKPRWSTSGL